MNKKSLEKIFRDNGALLRGHFLLSSGNHSSEYIQCAKVLESPEIASRLGEALASGFSADDIDLVVSPAMGGIIIGHEVARALGKRFIFTERESGIMKLRRGFHIAEEERCIVIEDVLTTGKSTSEVIDIVKKSGGSLIGVGVLIDRSKGFTGFGVRLSSLLRIDVPIYTPVSCPLCEAKVPLVKPGSRTSA